MPSFCPRSASITLPNVLQSLYISEFAPRLRAPSTGLLNRRFLPRHDLRSRRTITTVSINDIPVPSAEKPQPPRPTENEPFSNLDSANTPDVSDGKSSAQDTSATSSPSARRTKPRPETKNEKSKSDRKDRDRKDKKSAKRDRKDTAPKKPAKPEEWLIQKEALKKKFPQGWAPIKKLSPDAMDGIRHLHHVSPDQFTTAVLAEEFKVSPEAIRRILKSKWRPSGEEQDKRQQRWEKRHDRIWGHMSELGLREKPANSFKATAPVLYGHTKHDKPPSDK
ncbi:required for respiratory growth protein 9, mitochondrial [Aspergillus unguis]